MTLEITLPLDKKGGIKDLVFTILTKEYPLKLIEITNLIKKRYGKSVTFQAVRKAVLLLVESGVLVQKDYEFLINKEWIIESKKVLDDLYSEINKEKTAPKNIDSIKGELSVFTFSSLNELMKFWQDLIDNWFVKFKKGDYNLNCYQAPHVWEGLLHLDNEKKIMTHLKDKGIKSYILSVGNTPLDRQIAKFYSAINIKSHIQHSTSSFDKSYYVGTYGDLIVQTRYPEEITKLLDSFFKKSKTLKDLDLIELSKIVNKKISIKLTVIKNLEMAKQINNSILSQIE